MKLTIKSLSVDKGNIRWEIHIFGCRDIYKNYPIGVFNTEAENPESLILSDIGNDGMSIRENYKIMNCCKKCS
jgi:hypothetical protein